MSDYHGKTFGNWEVVRFINKLGNNHYYLCRCSCGKEKAVSIGNVVAGKSRSCGCLRNKLAGDRLRTHGQSHKGVYDLWCAMKRRCCLKTDSSYQNYGGRGITVCERWLKSFECFRDDMGPRPHRYSIERQDNDKGYSPENCVWASSAQQANNKRNNRIIEHLGVSKNVASWAKDAVCGENAFKLRMWYGWPMEIALTEPSGTTFARSRKGKTW